MGPRLIEQVGTGVSSARVLVGSGVVRPYSPRTLARLALTMHSWGTGLAGGFTSLAVRNPDQVGLIDDLGELTYGELHRRSNALAHALAELGVGAGGSVALMCRNHRGLVEATIAVAKLGADVVYLNTAFAGPQLVEVLDRESVETVICDQEFTGLLAEAEVENTILAWVDEPEQVDVPTLAELIGAGDESDLPAPEQESRIIILTSGTTGTPKGAPRSKAGVAAAVSLLSRMPLRHGWRTHIAAPLFHTWGFAHLALGMLLSSTVVLTRRFDPETALRLVEEHRCQSLVVIPVMLQRILQLPEEALSRHSLPTVRVTAVSGSALPGDLATEWMDRFGDNIYNIYGSTEVAYATIATPEDLRAAPGTAGKVPIGATVRILDDRGEEVPAGSPGRIFVGNGILFEGYTGGGHKEVVDGLMSSGDVGRLDEEGRLFIEGRDDEMIVSGGENVFPREVEDCLSRHTAVVEAAAVGVKDPDFGERLRAYVVRSEEVSEDDLRDWVKQHLARYKVPRDFVWLDELPRNATGKVRKLDLPAD